ncbi:hypothetical protein ACJRO7_026013 [Eucalyptus globulus]|uniref:NB-ARC domain-containing protein n=1 Tax=Eucalyptus globulus TaxID=34317 RepID=A0ABD3KAX9_EUCGL
MDFASPLLELVKGLWGLASKPLGYIYNPKDNVCTLDKANENLKASSEDVKAKVEREEGGGGAQRTNQVENWLGEVQEFEGRVDQVLQEAREHDRIKCLSRCLPRNCWSSYKLGKRVDQLLNEVRELQHKKGEISDFTSSLPPPRQVLKMPLDKTVGLDSSLNTVWKWLVDKKEARVIGLYGAGGVGKTTLMRRINEKLSHANHGFEVVIWVVVSKHVNEDSIRDTIRKKLNIKDENWEGQSRDERALHLGGIPHSSLENESKIVFTTREKQVCHLMGANEIFEVRCLTPEEALALFENNIGKSCIHSHLEIQELANNIVRECQGLPLALITVERAMAGRENPNEWKHALTTLRNNPCKLSCMVEEVYHILQFSYNSLNDSTIKLCFIYCCLFPEDYPIRVNNLIELWIGEGLLRDTNDVYSMRYKGEYVLRTLEMACLLESGHDDYDDYEGRHVKMHDVIRDMATWIARDRGQKENKLLVIVNQEDMSTEMISKWREAKKVSLWGQWIQNIDQTPPMCSQLKTLFVRETNVTLVPKGFFNSMTARLTVLDLSNNRKIKSFPEGICNLINLRYLNLSDTRISAVPKKIRKLTHLRWLLLDCIFGDLLIPRGAIASLPLNVLSMWGPYQDFNEEVVEELGHMQGLIDLSIKVCQSSSTLKIFQSFQRCIRRVNIKNCEGLTHIPISHSLKGSGNFSHLDVLNLVDCRMLVKMEINQGIGQAPNCYCFPSLVEVHVSCCGFLDLSWLVHAPKLQRLRVDHCDSMEKIIGDGTAREELAASRLFSRLKSLKIFNLPKLRSICDHALLFPQGVEFLIRSCPGLRKLPLDSNGARRSFWISGDTGWWEKFEWDPAVRVTFDLRCAGPVEEMTYGEAERIIEGGPIYFIRMEFLPREPSE